MTSADPAPPTTHAADDAERAAAIGELASLTLPLMWSLRQQAMRVFEPLGLRPTRVLLLELVAAGVDRPGTLAEMLDSVPPAITAMLNELEGKEYLTRTPDAGDRRRTRLALTPRGDAFLTRTRERWYAASDERLRSLATADLTALTLVLRRLLAESTP